MRFLTQKSKVDSFLLRREYAIESNAGLKEAKQHIHTYLIGRYRGRLKAIGVAHESSPLLTIRPRFGCLQAWKG
jgi:hypothetical protein